MPFKQIVISIVSAKTYRVTAVCFLISLNCLGEFVIPGNNFGYLRRHDRCISQMGQPACHRRIVFLFRLRREIASGTERAPLSEHIVGHFFENADRLSQCAISFFPRCGLDLALDIYKKPDLFLVGTVYKIDRIVLIPDKLIDAVLNGLHLLHFIGVDTVRCQLPIGANQFINLFVLSLICIKGFYRAVVGFLRAAELFVVKLFERLIEHDDSGHTDSDVAEPCHMCRLGRLGLQLVRLFRRRQRLYFGRCAAFRHCLYLGGNSRCFRRRLVRLVCSGKGLDSDGRAGDLRYDETKVVPEVQKRRGNVQDSLYGIGLDGLLHKLRPGVFQDVCLALPRGQHNVDLAVRRSRRVREFRHDVVVGGCLAGEVFYERGELVRAQLAADAHEYLFQFDVRQQTIFVGFGKGDNALHRVDDLSRLLRRLYRVVAVDFQRVGYRLDAFLGYFDGLAGLVHDGAEFAGDVHCQRAPCGRRLGACLLRFGRDRADDRQRLLDAHAEVRGGRGDDRHSRRQFVEAGSVVVVDIVRLVNDGGQLFHGAAHVPRRVYRD